MLIKQGARWIVFSIGALALLATCTTSAAQTPSDVDILNVIVHPENPGRSIPADFLGFSYEAPVLAQGYFDSGNAPLMRLIANLGSGTLRFGGNSVEETYWSPVIRTVFPNAKATIIGSDLDHLFAFAKQIGWRVILGLNLGHYDPDLFADEAAYAVIQGAASLLALEIGNEPDLFSKNGLRLSTWGYEDFRREFDAYVQAIRARTPNAPIAGPATTGSDKGKQWFPRFLQDEGSQLVLATQHLYPMSDTPTNPPDSPTYPTIANMLSPQLMERVAQTIDQLTEVAQANHLPLRIAETNSISGSPGRNGKEGVSNVFASALWGADYLFTLVEHGAQGVNFHGGFGCGGFTPICSTGTQYVARPLYYGMLLFHAAGQGRMVPVEIHGSTMNVTTHAILGDDGKLRVVLINKEEGQAVTAEITTGQPYAQATAMRLIGPSLNAQTGITLGGSAVNPDGSWTPESDEPVIYNGDLFQLALPAASAVVVTFE